MALEALAAMPQTHVAVISGRSLADLARRVEEAGEAHLVGSHGSEFEAGFATPISPRSVKLLKETVATAQAIAERTPGALVEKKPASVAFHYRNADEEGGGGARSRHCWTGGGWEGLHVRHGKKVIELSVVQTDKGQVLQSLRQRLGATAVLFLGDDVTDEDALRHAGRAGRRGEGGGRNDGGGASRGGHAGGGAAAGVRGREADGLAGGLGGGAIEQHSLLSDQRTMALVDPRGRVSWMCLPRLDSSAMFAELLGGPTAGYFEMSSGRGAGGRPSRSMRGRRLRW